jgi:hypothetical protein
MDFKSLLKNKWVWIGLGGVGVLWYVARQNAANASAAQDTSLATPYSPYTSVSPYPYYGGGGTASTGTTTSTDSLSYLNSLIAAQTAQNTNQYDLATQQAADQLQLGLASLTANQNIATTNADVTNNAEAVSAFQSSLGNMNKNFGQVNAAVSLQNGVLALNTLGIATTRSGGNTNTEQNSQLISGVGANGVPTINLPTGGTVNVWGPALKQATGGG